MDVIGTNLGSTNKDNGIYVTFIKLFKSTLEKLGLYSITRVANKKNEKFNEIIHKLYDNEDDITTFLLERGYQVLEIFKSDENLIRYVNENEIQIKIKNGKIIIGNIIKDEKNFECIGIVLAIEVDITENQERALANEIESVKKKIHDFTEELDKFIL